MATKLIDHAPEVQRAIVIHPDGRGGSARLADERLEEAVGLSAALDLDVRAAEVARVRRVVPATLFGMGKVDEIAALVRAAEADVVVIDDALTPVQQRNLEKAWEVKVIDRSGLILEIFGRRARTAEGRLQVELARLEYERSRLVRTWTHLERQRGGTGSTGGPGETQIELDRRMIADRIDKLKAELEEVRRTRALHRKARKRVPFPAVALVGYTNAGKSTLINALTNAEVYAADQLFATLDPTTRRLTVTDADHQAHTMLLTDTVGFIHKLPPSLVDAFRATLEEVTEADALIHVVDLSHPAWQHQLESVEKILEEMPIMPAQALLVFNKLDQVSSEALQAAQLLYPQAIYISAGDRLGFETLRQRLTQMLKLL